MGMMNTAKLSVVRLDVTSLALFAWMTASCVTSGAGSDSVSDDDIVDDGSSGNAEEVVRSQYQSGGQDAAPATADAAASAEEEVPDSVLESAGESNALSQAETQADNGANVSPEDEQALAALVGEDQQPSETPAQPDAAAQVEVAEVAEVAPVAETAPVKTSPVEMPPVPVTSVERAQAPATHAASTLSWLGYNYRAGEGLLHVEMKTKGNPHYNVFQEINKAGQPELVVRLFATKVRRPIRRRWMPANFALRSVSSGHVQTLRPAVLTSS